jgi:hypothetical protein
MYVRSSRYDIFCLYDVEFIIKSIKRELKTRYSVYLLFITNQQIER